MTREIDGAKSQQGLSVLSTRPEMEASRHAPTLMGGVVAGSQGQVRVWTPQKPLTVWRAVTRLAGLTFMAAYVLLVLLNAVLHMHPMWGMPVWFLDIGAAWVCLSIVGAIFDKRLGPLKALRRPCYVTTDDAGIGITTWRGQVALSWEQIISFGYTADTVALSLKPMDGPWVETNLSGYPDRVRKELIALIIEKARLKPCVTLLSVPLQYARPGYAASLYSGAGNSPSQGRLPPPRSPDPGENSGR